MSRTIRWAVLSVAVGWASQMAGCANAPIAPQDGTFGDTVRAARQAQTLNPAGADKRDKAVGLDGKAAVSAVDRYQESFKTPPKTFEVLNISTSSPGQ